MKTMKSKNEVKRKYTLATMKFTMKKFQIVSKYANYQSNAGQQNAPSKLLVA